MQVPYCSTCVRHARAFQAGTAGSLLYPAALVAFAGFVVGIIGLAVGIGRNNEMLALFGPSVFATAAFVGYRLVMRSRAAVDARHSSAAPVLRIAGWTDGTIVLDCDNTSYALALRQANPG
jgi:hypothetical protein